MSGEIQPAQDGTTCRLRVDLDAIARNYRTFVQASVGDAVSVGAVVKADGYGVGAEPVARRLIQEGCRSLFVASTGEAVSLRSQFGVADLDALYVFAGPVDEASARTLASIGVVPVLNSQHQIDLWREHGDGGTAALHVDTGMNRLGVPFDATGDLRLAGVEVGLVMTHLACADDPTHALNAIQLQRFSAALSDFAGVPTSIGNSAGVLIGTEFQGDVARPGIGLYGGNPYSALPNPMAPAVTLQAQVIQRRTIARGATVGYGATYVADRPTEVAIVAAGYADGVPRLLSNNGEVAFQDTRAPIIGRVTMDLIHVDVTDGPKVDIGDWVEIFGESISVDEVAVRCRTVSYEVLTGIGSRVPRLYSST